jgi:hypothetical protein
MKINPKARTFLSLSFKVLGIVLFGMTILLTACKKISDTTQADTTSLNVVNASPGNLAINFYLNNVFVAGPSLSYTERSGYIQTYAGGTKFDASVGGTNQLILTSTINLISQKYYTLFFAGTNQSPAVVFTEDDLFSPATGKAKIRFIHLSPDAPALDLAIKGGMTLFGARDFKSVSDFIEIDPATYSFQLKAGTSSAVAELINVPIEAGRIYTVWAGGLMAASSSDPISIQAMANK